MQIIKRKAFKQGRGIHVQTTTGSGSHKLAPKGSIGRASHWRRMSVWVDPHLSPEIFFSHLGTCSIQVLQRNHYSIYKQSLQVMYDCTVQYTITLYIKQSKSVKLITVKSKKTFLQATIKLRKKWSIDQFISLLCCWQQCCVPC